MTKDAVNPRLESSLERFGLRSFREGQREVVEAVLSGVDCLCIMPTGGGKSLCYQLPSIVREGVTLVVSPLIALMKDQVDALQEKGFRADYINSSLIPSEQSDRLVKLRNGEYDMLYVAPERFRSRHFVEAAISANIQLLAVDEAHCISEWGHDFRHDYARLGQFRQRLGNPQTIALTATATSNVRDDVVTQLQMAEPRVFIAGFARPNLEFSVVHAGTRTEKDESLASFLRQTPGSGIIYSSTRKGCQQIADSLEGRTGQRRIGVYHAGLSADDRRSAQEAFMSDETPIVVATNAFGMGIDKSDVRFVVHYNMPGTIEAYYQEAGRAGRDGQVSRCRLLYSGRDRKIQEFFIENSYPSPTVVKTLFEFLRNHPDDPIEITQQQLQMQVGLDLSSEGIGTCERLLERAGAIERLEPQNNQGIVRLLSDLPTLVDLLPKNATKRRKILRAVEKVAGSVRHDDVYIRPSEIANLVEMPTNAISRGLRELSDLDVFEYIPPFRGRAIRIVDRTSPFSKFDIDFESLAERKAADYEKLRCVIRYATSEHCRQLEMLGYFADPSATECERCDNCLSSAGRPAPPDIQSTDERVLQTVRIALSGVARAKQRFGKQMIAAMLGGSQSSKITKWRLNELSTFGLLKSWRQTELSELLERMSDAGLFEQNEVDRFRPVLKLTAYGEQVMLGEAPLKASFLLPNAILRRIVESDMIAATSKSTPPKPEPRTDADDPGDSEVAGAMQNETDGGNETTVPMPKNEQTATDTIDVISAPASRDVATSNIDDGATCGNRPSPNTGDRGPSVTSPNDATSASADFIWTWRLADSHFSILEIVAIRRLDVPTVLAHLSRAIDEGKDFDLSVFPAAMRNQFDALIESPASGRRIDSAHLDLYRKCLAAKSVGEPK